MRYEINSIYPTKASSCFFYSLLFLFILLYNCSPPREGYYSVPKESIVKLLKTYVLQICFATGLKFGKP